ncbi:MAG: hypothetical protein IH948_09595, partial [Bacteroidetes bacterium]|nr:hypothetical protein [Bacteroidota bacterium]
LLHYLAQHCWGINPKFNIGEEGYEHNISGATAGLVIGDRALQLNGKFRYAFDLAEAWTNFTRLPFVFACWMARNDLHDGTINKFNESMEWGMNHLDELMDLLVLRTDIGLDLAQLKQYFNYHVSYEFDADKKAGLEKFMNYISHLQPGTINV